MMRAIQAALLLALAASTQIGRAGQKPPPAAPARTTVQLPRSVPDAPPTLSLSPAVIMANGSFGQGLTEELTLSNYTNNRLGFDLIAEDVTTRNGKRVFFPAGEIPGSIAATAVFLPQHFVVNPYSSASVRATLTIPAKTALRAVVAIFRGRNVAARRGSVGMVASLGALFVFTLSNDFKLDATPVSVREQTSDSNATFDQSLENAGTEPVMPVGVAAILGMSGGLVGKVAFRPQRLLPGEKLPFSAEYSTQLNPGHYRLLVSFEYAGKTMTTSREFTVR